jgi:hypothetical protein
VQILFCFLYEAGFHLVLHLVQGAGSQALDFDVPRVRRLILCHFQLSWCTLLVKQDGLGSFGINRILLLYVFLKLFDILVDIFALP